jgi:membrane associated rhomboid family serine protease
MPYYGGRSRFGGLRMMPPALGVLILVNVAIFVLGLIPLGAGSGLTLSDVFEHYGALFPIGSGYFRPWQYVTYMFLHANFIHIFFNMLALWMFGMEIEGIWGTRRFLTFYFICGLGAALLHTIVTPLLGQGGPTIGASGAIMGVMVAFGMAFPDRIIFVSFFLPIKAKYFVLIYAAFDLYNGITGVDGVAHFAHLGGALTGFLLLKFGGRLLMGGLLDRAPKTIRRMQDQRSGPQQGARIIDVDYRDVRTPQPQRRSAPVMDFGEQQARIDAILDKISHQGYQSLTDEEKAILNDAGRRMK